MSGRWWRAYDEAIDDPKVQLLEPALFKAWFNLCCLASANGGTLPTMAHIAFKLRVPVLQAELTVSALIAVELLDQHEDGVIEPHNWKRRQFKTDVTDPTNAERQRRYRKRYGRNASKRDHTVTVTPTVTPTVTRPLRPNDQRQRTETETETEKNTTSEETKEVSSSVVALARVTRGSRLAADWLPSDADLKAAGEIGLRLYEIDNEISKFRDYWHARAGPGAIKRDWSATWRNWCRKAREQQGKGNGSRSNVVDAGERLIAAEKARTGDCSGPLLDLTPASSTTSHPPARPLPER
jgi:hypothetical protein